MAKIDFLYGKGTLSIDIPKERLNAVLLPHEEENNSALSENEIVNKAFDNPIGSEALSKLAEGKEKVVIIASDHTRPVPSRLIMPRMLQEIRKGNPDADITILIATGCHRETTKDELVAKFGEEIVENEKIVIHISTNAEDCVTVGTLPSGARLSVNKIAAEADLLVSEGFVEPHFFAGFSGGRKSVLPGICSRTTVLANHCSAFIDSPYSRTGILEGNPIHKDMIAAAQMLKLAFICNVVLDTEKHVIAAAAGDMQEAHKSLVDFVLSRAEVKPVMSDIVISTNSGYPLDQNIYQSVKGMTAAEATVKDGGVIIMCATASDGHGGESFYNTFKNEPDLRKMMEGFLATPAEETIPDQWESQILARILLKSTVLYLSEADDQLVKDFHMTPVHSLEEALKEADEILGYEGKITAIPDGIGVIVR